MPNNITLIAENYLLKKKLEAAQNWMKREISGQKKLIQEGQVRQDLCERKTDFLGENIEDIVNKKIQEFFGEIMLQNIPAEIIANIATAEMSYYHFRHNPKLDGFAVISSYHKALDIIIETSITSHWRKFIDIKRLPEGLENDPLEKALHNTIFKNYSLGVGKLFHLLQTLREESSPLLNKEKAKGGNLPLYTFLFGKFLSSHYELKKILLEENSFLHIFQELIESEVLGEKRHLGTISFVETRGARKLLIGDFKNKNCLLYQLMLLGEV